MTDLKRVLMELGNKLAQEHGFEPGTQPVETIGQGVSVQLYDAHQKRTSIITLLTDFVNQHPEAQQALHELGFDWSMPAAQKTPKQRYDDAVTALQYAEKTYPLITRAILEVTRKYGDGNLGSFEHVTYLPDGKGKVTLLVGDKNLTFNYDPKTGRIGYVRETAANPVPPYSLNTIPEIYFEIVLDDKVVTVIPRGEDDDNLQEAQEWVRKLNEATKTGTERRVLDEIDAAYPD
jgi:hypothetical protein